MIVISLISNRPFQNVSIPTTKTSNSTIEQYNNKVIPLVYGDYTANSGFTNGTDVYACPFLKNDGKNFMYIVPENTSGTDKLEFYDKGMKRFLELTGTDTTIATEDSAKVLKVPKLMRRQFKMLPDEIDGGVVEQEGSGAGSIAVTGSIANCFDGSTSTEVDINHSGNFADIRGVTMKLVMPQVSGKITAITLGLDGTITQAYSSGSPGSGDGLFVNLATSLSSNFGSTSGDVEIIGSSSSYNRTTSIDLTASYSAVNIASVLVDGALPDDLYLSFRWDTADGNVDCNSWNISLENVYMTVTADNDTANEPIASSDFNAGIDKVYLGRDITSNTFTGHSATQDALNNPVSIHRQLLKSVLDYDLADDTDNVDSGYKSVADLRDSDSTHWKTRLELQDTESIESVLQQLQYEGCFFFEFSPQAQQTAITGVSSLRYFTIANGTPTADKSLSEVDISDYEIGITEVGDLETSLVVNYKKHPAENEYLQQKTYVSAVSGSVHSTIFDNAAHQKQELNLDMLYSAVDGAGGDRNSDWINFRSALFGQYKTTMSATIINPEKYGMLQVGDFLDFGDTLFGNLGTPFSEISDTFDDMVAMPTRLFSEQWSDKRFIITSLKRQIGKVSVQCREV